MTNLRFEGSSLVALLACYVFLSPPLKIQIQTITRRAVILPASGMSENLLLISHVKKKKKKRKKKIVGEERKWYGFVCDFFWHQLKWTAVRSYGSDWLGDYVTHITVWNTATKNTVGDRKGTYRFDFGWFRPEAALWDCRRGSAATHDSFTLFHSSRRCDILLFHCNRKVCTHTSQINAWQKWWITLISRLSMFECLRWQKFNTIKCQVCMCVGKYRCFVFLYVFSLCEAYCTIEAF